MPRNSPRLSAGIVLIDGELPPFRYLLLRAYRYWDFPKGGVEPNESPLDAAQREVREETGISSLEFRWGEVFVETEPYAGGKIARYYIAVSPSTFVSLGLNPLLGRAEHQEYRWVSYDEGQKLLGPRVRKVLDWARTVSRDSG